MIHRDVPRGVHQGVVPAPGVQLCPTPRCTSRRTSRRLANATQCSCTSRRRQCSWTRAEASSAFGVEVGRAMDTKARLLLVHEMIGVGGQKDRFGCEFTTFF
eukprot:6994711-Prymnesium_polylepis.1